MFGNFFALTFSVSHAVDMSKKSKPRKKNILTHVGRVYALLSFGVLALAAGSYFDNHYFHVEEKITGFFGLGLIVLANDGRIGECMFLAGAFLVGMGLGRLFHMGYLEYPNELIAAVVIAVSVFVSFSIVGLTKARDNTSSYFTTSVVSAFALFMSIAGLMHIWTPRSFLFDLRVHMCLWMTVGYITADTRDMVKRFEETCRDKEINYVHHARELFLHLFRLFMDILVILSKMEDKRDKEKEEEEKESNPSSHKKTQQPPYTKYFERNVSRD